MVPLMVVMDEEDGILTMRADGEDKLADLPGLGMARLKVEGGPNDRYEELSAEVYDALTRRASEILRKRVALEGEKNALRAEEDALRADIKSAFAAARAKIG